MPRKRKEETVDEELLPEEEQQETHWTSFIVPLLIMLGVFGFVGAYIYVTQYSDVEQQHVTEEQPEETAEHKDQEEGQMPDMSKQVRESYDLKFRLEQNSDEIVVIENAFTPETLPVFHPLSDPLISERYRGLHGEDGPSRLSYFDTIDGKIYLEHFEAHAGYGVFRLYAYDRQEKTLQKVDFNLRNAIRLQEEQYASVYTDRTGYEDDGYWRLIMQELDAEGVSTSTLLEFDQSEVPFARCMEVECATEIYLSGTRFIGSDVFDLIEKEENSYELTVDIYELPSSDLYSATAEEWEELYLRTEVIPLEL